MMTIALDHGHQPELKVGIRAWKFCKCAYNWLN